MRGQPVGPRAAWPLVAAMLALAASIALGAGASWVSATTPQATTPQAAPTPAHEAGPAVLGVATLGGSATSPPDLGAPAYVDSAEAAFGWRAGPAPAAPAAIAAVPASKPSTGTTDSTATTTAASTQPWWKRYSGTNHVWMPTLGLSKAVYFFSCTRSQDPDNLVYRYGCAGTNNVYLLGHAGGVFKPLHDAYYNGKLRKGMPVVYADGSGVERLYRVTSWRVVSPFDAAWALASQPVPSMTLQTCIGKNDSLRLIVRLVQVDK
jgi:hypothetical protein